jgi:transcription elongation factor Elf1
MAGSRQGKYVKNLNKIHRHIYMGAVLIEEHGIDRIFKCPNCNKGFNCYYKTSLAKTEIVKHCPNCGQRIDAESYKR